MKQTVQHGADGREVGLGAISALPGTCSRLRTLAGSSNAPNARS
jgi:hypothetical protein